MRTQGCDITRAPYNLYPLELTTKGELKPHETAEELQKDDAFVEDFSENNNNPSLGSGRRPRRKASTDALKWLKYSLDELEDLNEEKTLPVGKMS